MITFKYSIVPRLIYRWANIPITLILFLYAMVSATALFVNLFATISFVIHIILMLLINRFYFRVYKLYPFTIEMNNEKMICSDYFMSSKNSEYKLSEITKLSGNIFSGAPHKPLYIHFGEERKIGISPHLRDFNKFLTMILSNVKKELYESALQDIQIKAEGKRKGKKKPAK